MSPRLRNWCPWLCPSRPGPRWGSPMPEKQEAAEGHGGQVPRLSPPSARLRPVPVQAIMPPSSQDGALALERPGQWITLDSGSGVLKTGLQERKR